MFNEKLSTCPNCSGEMEKGFHHQTTGITWVRIEELQHFVFVSEDLNKAGWKKFLPCKVALNPAYHCEACQIFIVDYGRVLTRAEANELAQPVEREL